MLLALLLPLTASAGTFSEGKAMAKEGRFTEAVRFWLDALDEDEFDQGAIKGLDRYSDYAYEQQLDLEARLQNQAGRSKDFAEGVSAFLEKRDALFTGE